MMLSKSFERYNFYPIIGSVSARLLGGDLEDYLVNVDSLYEAAPNQTI